MPACVVEFDPLFLGGFALPAEVLSERLEKYGVADNDPYRFVRQLYGRPFSSALASLLPPDIDVAHVERRLAATYGALLQQTAQQAIQMIQSTLKSFAKSKVSLAIITRLRTDIVEELLSDVTDDVVVIPDPVPLATGLKAETLQAALVALGLPTRQCLSLLVCGASVRASVQIGLRAAVVLDPMVAFENCAGADLIAERFTKTFMTKLKTRLELLSTK